MNRTGIEYLDFSWNPIAMRCTPVSEGCANCWHRRMANRLAGNEIFPEEVRKAYAGEGPSVLIQKRLEGPLRRKKPARFGVQFMGDLFHDNISTNFIHRVFDNMFYAPWHIFLVLTKRPQRMAQFVDVLYHRIPKRPKPIQNIHLGVSVENQWTADERIPLLLQTPAAVRFVSLEPLLGPVDLGAYLYHCTIADVAAQNMATNEDGGMAIQGAIIKSWAERPGLDWVIVGSESGRNRRPAEPDWIRDIRDQCVAAGVSFFLKQMEINGKLQKMPLLDGVLHREYPRGKERRS